MKLSDIRAKGGFVSTEPVKKTIKWFSDGEQHEGQVFIVSPPFGEVDSAISQNEDNRSRSRSAHLISIYVRFGEEGDEQMTYAEAYGLAPSLGWALVTAINEASVPKALRPTTKHGTSSCSQESAGEP